MHFQLNEPRNTEPHLFIEDRHYSVNAQIPDNSKVNKKNNFSLIIPAYNEELRISLFLENLQNYSEEFSEIIVISDGNDRTADIVRSYCPSYTVIEYKHKLGKGGAIMEGLKVASGDVIGYVDADGSISPADILKIFSSVTRTTPMVIGSRWVQGSIIETRQPISRVILGRFYHYVTFAILGLTHKDTQCGLKAFSVDIVEELKSRVKVKNFSFDTALLYHCKLLGCKVAELPITWRNIEGTKIKPIKTAFFMFVTIIALRLIHSEKTSKLRKVFAEVNDMLGSN